MSAWALLTELDRLNVARKGEAAALRGFLRGRYRGLIEKLKAPWADKWAWCWVRPQRVLFMPVEEVKPCK